jgi:hypothetical protein
VLYQLSYIGSKTQLSAIRRQRTHLSASLRIPFVRRRRILFAVQPRLHCKQAEGRKRHQPNPLVRNRGVCQRSQNHVGHECYSQPIHWSLVIRSGARPLAQLWCTGKDSNLRTPLGGADLQSAGFNHSPTCAETAKLPLRPGSVPFPTALYGICAHTEKTLQASQQNRKTRMARAHSRTKTTTRRKNS